MLAPRVFSFALLALAAPALSACMTAAVFGTATTVATAVREERSIGDQINDAAIKGDLNGRLLQAEHDVFTNVSTTVLEGRVYLRGKVESEEARDEAVRIAWRTPGVREVHNDLIVAEPSSLEASAGDTWLAGKVRFALLDKAAIKDVNYTIAAQDGVVYLMGIAQDDNERLLAVETARSVEGVAEVVDYLVLKNDPRRTGETAEASPGTS